MLDSIVRDHGIARVIEYGRGDRTPNQEPSKVILAALLESLEGLPAGTASDRIEGVSGESEWASKAAPESSGG